MSIWSSIYRPNPLYQKGRRPKLHKAKTQPSSMKADDMKVAAILLSEALNKAPRSGWSPTVAEWFERLNDDQKRRAVKMVPRLSELLQDQSYSIP